MNNRILTYKSLAFVGKTLLMCVLLMLIGVLPAFSDSATNDSINELASLMKSKAKQCERKEEVYNAIEYYRQYLQLKSKDIKLSLKLANLYFSTRNYPKANQYYDSVISFNPKKYPMAYYQKGIVCMNLEKYDDAMEAFAKFKKYYRGSNEKNGFKKQATIYAESSQWALDHANTEIGVKISHPGQGLNHSDIDFAPFPVDNNTILYGAMYTDSAQGIAPVRQIYKAVRKNGQWKSLGLLSGAVNNSAFNTGNAVISSDGSHLYFTRLRRNWQNVYINEIYSSAYVDEEWQTPEKLPFPVNDENYNTTQPAIGKNLKSGNDILYFVSDREGGKGGLDIWYVEYDSKTNTWKTPVNLDKGINTAGDECCPFYDFSTRTLYFSSKGRKTGYGGFDIFKAVGSSKKWTDVSPLPKPINSSYDDYYYSLLKDSKEGFFSSNRPGALSVNNGSCCDDIFSFKITECVKINSWGSVRNYVNADFYNHLNSKYHLGLQFPEDNHALADVPVELYLAGEKEEDEILLSSTTTNEAGNYSFDLEPNKNYTIQVKNFGYFEKRFQLSTFGKDCSDSLKIGSTLISYLPKVNARVNIYYEHNKFSLSDSAQRTIDTTLIPLFDLFPKAIIEIGSHSDSIGSDQYNLKLSQKRAESVVNYLISKGIPTERLVAKGYGMRFPIAPNKNSDGTDNPQGRQLNRRTEIKIVGEIKPTNLEE